MRNPFNRESMSSRRFRRASLPTIIAMVILALIVASCGGSAAEPTVAPTNTAAPAVPTDTPTTAPAATATPVPPTAAATAAPPTATAEPAATNTPAPPTATATPVAPTATAAPEPTEEPQPTEQPEPTAAPTVDNSALIAQGRSLFEANGCAGCHGEPGAGGIVSPDLKGISARAGSRVAGLSAEAYIRQSIQDPNAFVVPDCPPGPCPAGLMPQTFGASLSPEQLTALVTYLMSLN